MDYAKLKRLVVMGAPKRQVEEFVPHLNSKDDTQITYIDSLVELVDATDLERSLDDLDTLVNALLAIVQRKGAIYLGSPVRRKSEDEKALKKLEELAPDAIIDEALELLKLQLGEPILDALAFEGAVLTAIEMHNLIEERVVFVGADETNVCVFHAPMRASQPHTIKWCADDTIELDGAIIRRTALMGVGHFKQEVLGGQVLTPEEVVGFIAHRMALNGVEDLVGYGRAFGPGKEDHTNATLTPEGRMFRAKGVVGVVAVHGIYVTKSKPEMVQRVALALRAANPKAIVFLHQQCKEIYEGEEALKAFRGVIEPDGKITLGGKSTKHARVDAGAYCLYTENGDGTITMPAVIGNFELSNDGMIYAPKALLDSVRGYLKERVHAVRDFANMSEELLYKYYSAHVDVQVGETIYPGDTVFTIDGVARTWESKADYGIVTEVIDKLSTKLVHVEVRIDAWFEGDVKMRGFGKGLVAPSEACGVHSSSGHNNHFIIGAGGIIKDSKAAVSRMTNVAREEVRVQIEYCERDWELLLAKHNPTPDDAGCYTKVYEGLCVMSFDEQSRIVTIIDDNAIVCDITFMIEASPVAQSVGSSSMTLPQMSWLSSLPTANQWLCEEALPGMIARVNALAYLHAAGNRVPVELS